MKSESIDDLFARFGPKYRWLVTITGMTTSFTMVLTGTIVNVAVPDVMGAYGVGQDKAQFLQTAFPTRFRCTPEGILPQFREHVGVTLDLRAGLFYSTNTQVPYRGDRSTQHNPRCGRK